MQTLEFHLTDETQTIELGKALAKAFVGGGIIFLQGELGAGKTTLTRGFLRGLGFQGTVKSPTYTLVEVYQLAELAVFHFDLYRLANPQELEHIGLADYLIADAICLIEWPQHGQPFLPIPDIQCELRVSGEQRDIILTAMTEKGQGILLSLEAGS